MKRATRVFLGTFLLLGSAIALILLYIAFVTEQSGFLGDAAGFALIICVCVALVGVIVLPFDPKPILQYRWKKITGRPYAEFPQTPEEREWMLAGGWLERQILRKLAENANRNFSYRDGWAIRLQQASSATPSRSLVSICDSRVTNDPSHLGGLRKDIAARVADHERDISWLTRESKLATRRAADAWQRFLRCWDFHRDLLGQPPNPKTGKPWDGKRSPSEYLEWVENGCRIPGNRQERE